MAQVLPIPVENPSSRSFPSQISRATLQVTPRMAQVPPIPMENPLLGAFPVRFNETPPGWAFLGYWVHPPGSKDFEPLGTVRVASERLGDLENNFGYI